MDEQNRDNINDELNEETKSEQDSGVPPYVSSDKLSSEEKDRKNKRATIIIVAMALLGVFILAVVLIGIVKLTSSGGNQVTTNAVAENTLPVAENTTVAVTQGETTVPDTLIATTTEKTTEKSVNKTDDTKSTTKKSKNNKKNKVAETEAQTISGLPPLTQTGDNILSDSPDNKYIKMVSEKYDVSSDRLVAIYAVPDKGNNFVLEFDGSKDSSGKIIKSPDTLLKVHQIDEKGSIKTATGTRKGNIGVSYTEGMVVFYMVTNIVMPQYPDYFTGVK